MAECRQTIAKLDNQNMKAIKGLEDRLYALDQMIASCSRLVNEQKELAQVIQMYICLCHWKMVDFWYVYAVKDYNETVASLNAR